MTNYLILKYIHVTSVVTTFLLFFLRGVWMLRGSPRLNARWVKIAPHVNDTVLITSALLLAAVIGQYPGVDGWLTAKVVALLAYIVIGSVALKRGRSRTIRLVAWFLAMAVFFYIVSVALTKNPFPF